MDDRARWEPLVDADWIRRDGFVVVKDVFSHDEVESMRAALLAVRDREHEAGLALPFDADMPANVRVNGDLPGKGELRRFDYLVFDPRIISCARQALGDALLYFGDSTFQTGEGERGFHRDNADRDDRSGPDWKGDDYSLVRIGVYLQDHAMHSGGLQVKVGSHLASEPRRTPTVRLPCAKGDIAIWNLRITHSGNFVRPRGLDVCLPPSIEGRIPRFLRVPEERERVAVFLTYGLAGDRHTDHYIDWQRSRAECVSHWEHSGTGAYLEALAESRGVQLSRPIPSYGARSRSRERLCEVA
ncbi:phytanoyl-CoA dioxygenase family protein [bacterium]|nr:phytanoyl-CoA dioxygenase family protein [bacterium]